MTTARRLAARVLTSVMQKNQFSNAALSKALDASDLSPRDKGFCTELVYGTLRWARPLEQSLRRALDKPNQKIDDIIMPHLLIAAYQLQYLSDTIPPHAVVNEAVNEVKRIRRYLAGFANVILKRLGSPIAGTFGLPEILIETIITQLPIDEKDTACAAMNDRPTTWVHSSNLDLENPHPFVPGAFAGQHSDKYYIQDPASQVAALLVNATPSSFVIDLCAAPGGKTMILKNAAYNGRVLAVDISTERVNILRENIKRFKLDIDVVICDARKLKIDKQADFVLLDAPCTGLGTLRRHPEIKLRYHDKSLPELLELQQQLLNSAAEYVKSGGILVYSVCSPLAAEGSDQIQDFLNRHPQFEREHAQSVLSWLPDDAVNAEGEIHLWPHRHDCDAFFAARLKKR